MRYRLLLTLMLGMAPGPAAAQMPSNPVPPPEGFVDQLLDVANDPGTTRVDGPGRIGAGQQVTGPVAAIGGRLTVAGEVLGDVIVINGDLVVLEGGRIDGEVRIGGGRLRSAPEGAITGDVRQFAGRVRVVTRDGRLIREAVGRVDRRGLYIGGARLTVRTGRNYNRVEGLPVLFGPIFQTGGPRPLRFDALAIWRTEDDRTRDRFGYVFRAEQTFGPPSRRFAVGGSAFSRVRAIEAWGLDDLEASLSSFLLHQDHRDYFEERGWSAHLRTRIPGTGGDFELEYADRRMSALQVGAPWSLLDNDDPWRPLPIVASGTLQTLTARLTLDERNHPERPSDGWSFSGEVTWGLDGDLLLPDPVSVAAEDATPGALRPLSPRFRSGFFDLRRYARLSPDHDLALRVVAGGSLGGQPLPPQYQHALGGEGSLPGHPLMSVDCGARRSPVRVESGGGLEPVFQRYGCSRFALFQAEYRGRLPFGWSGWSQTATDEAPDWLPPVDVSPSWTVFFNAGRGWSQSPDFPDTGTVADVGAGILLGRVGAYVALPLTESGRSMNFFVRLQPRF
jgi:hypothetical protein